MSGPCERIMDVLCHSVRQCFMESCVMSGPCERIMDVLCHSVCQCFMESV